MPDHVAIITNQSMLQGSIQSPSDWSASKGCVKLVMLINVSQGKLLGVHPQIEHVGRHGPNLLQALIGPRYGLGRDSTVLRRYADALLAASRCFPEPLYCCTGRILDRRLEELGGKRFAPRADINAEDWPAINSWLQRAMTELQKLPLEPYEIAPGIHMDMLRSSREILFSIQEAVNLDRCQLMA